MDTYDNNQILNTLLQMEKNNHENNKKRIRIGLRCFFIIPLCFMVLMFLSNMSKLVFLVLWIISLFALGIYLIMVEYADYMLKEKIKEIYGIDDLESDALIDPAQMIEERLKERRMKS